MSFDPARPRYTLPFAGKEYELLGTMALIESVEVAFRRGIGHVALDVPGEMSVTDLSKLVAVLLSASSHDMTPADVKSLFWESVGLTGPAVDELRLHVYAFLTICLAPPEVRQKKAKEMEKLTGSLRSRGGSTRKSA